MKNSLILSRIICSTVLLAAAARPTVGADTVLKFSDPAKPGRLVVQVGFGDVMITGDDTQEVRITSDEDAQSNSQPRDDGFRRLDGDSGYSAGEADNVITVTFANLFPGKHGRNDTDVSITVPRQTSVTIERGGPGDMEVQGLNGDLEIRGAIGDIELGEVGGGVLVESVNGDVDASFTALVADKPVSITVVHGDVSLTVPADARANVQLRTLRGEMLTNFSEDQLKTRLENSEISADDVNVNVNVNVDVEQQVERSLAVAEKARRAAEKAREKAAKDAAAAQARGQANPVPHPMPVPMPPMPPMPPMAGGKLVVGKLNGGGTEVTVATITGDITLQKTE